MYAFGPLPKYKQSGRVIGTHQKIDRIARRHLKPFLGEDLPFPRINEILHFEGSRGPDGIKLKSPGRDEPHHFINPESISHSDSLLVAIRDHQRNLSDALSDQNMERAAFEAAWLAHAVTDGLTPAHHEPWSEQVDHLRHDDHRAEKVRSRVIMKGGSRKDFVRNNWQYWGAKGIMTSHTLFEAGVAVSSKPLKFQDAQLSTEHIAALRHHTFEELYVDMVQHVYRLGMYDEFKQNGWTRTLASQTTKELLPIIIRAVTLAWYDSYQMAVGKNS